MLACRGNQAGAALGLPLPVDAAEQSALDQAVPHADDVTGVTGDAGVRTSFAGVTLETVGGRITVDNQNGAISVTAVRPASGCRDISLKTSFSSIRVRVPEGLGYNLTARTSFGRISSELPVTSTGSIGGDTLNGTIGSSGCQLQLTDSNGSIEIAKAP